MSESSDNNDTPTITTSSSGGDTTIEPIVLRTQELIKSDPIIQTNLKVMIHENMNTLITRYTSNVIIPSLQKVPADALQVLGLNQFIQ